uniref:Uncharacterized protein n=1 Tax=viral metagenome TaxID=1070528 RepID=A0A6M3IGS9_9ZZZZ
MPSWIDQVIMENQDFRRRQAEEELRNLVLEQTRVQVEEKKAQQAAIAQALQEMSPGWRRGAGPGERVDVGGFSTGGAPMRQVAVGPSGVTPMMGGPPVSFQGPTPEQEGMKEELLRKQMGLSPTPKRSLEDEVQKELIVRAFEHRLRSTEAKEKAGFVAEERKELEKQKAEARENLQKLVADLKMPKTSTDKTPQLVNSAITSLASNIDFVMADPTTQQEMILARVKQFQELLPQEKEGIIEAAPESVEEAPLPPGLPPASKHKGKTLKGKQSGRTFRSDGIKWTEVK